MSEQDKSGLALHWQILIALIVGTIVGIAINPGAIELDVPVKVDVAWGKNWLESK